MNRTTAALACAILMAGCGTSTKETITSDPTAEVAPYSQPPAGIKPVRAAVVEFVDKTGSNVSGPAGEQLETQVMATKRFSLIDRMRLKDILKEQGLEGIVDPAELARPGRVRGVDYMFFGVVTDFRLMSQRVQTAGGILDRALPRIAPLDIDTSKTVITSDIGVDIKLVNSTTGEIVSKQFGAMKKELTAKAWGVRVLGIGGDARNNVQVDRESHGKLLRHAVDDALRKMLPDIDAKLTQPSAAACPKCKTELAAGNSFCAKCGTGAQASKCKCGADLEANARFCGKCGNPVEKK